MFENLLQDARHGLRLLLLNPGVAIVAILSLALGIGANTAIFQLLDAVRLRAIPVQHPEQLAIVKIGNFDSASGSFSSRYSHATNPQWEQIRAQQQGFSGIFAWSPEQINLARGGEIRMANVLWVSGGFFEVLGVKPEAGRLLNASDDHRGCAGAAVISDSFWRSDAPRVFRSGSRPNVRSRHSPLRRPYPPRRIRASGRPLRLVARPHGTP